MRQTTSILILAAWIAGLHPTSAWSRSEDELRASITINVNIHGALIFIDSVQVGTAPLIDYSVKPGRHRVCASSSNTNDWMQLAACEDVDLLSNEHRELVLNIPRVMRITSEPFGASVAVNDSLIGTTPFLLTTNAEKGTVTLSKAGYVSLTLPFSESTSILHGALSPIWGAGNAASHTYLDADNSQHLFPVILTASSAVVTGVAAAYFKIRADNLYSDYTRTGNTSNLNRVKRLDAVSGIALGASQVSLLLLTYFLLSQ